MELSGWCKTFLRLDKDHRRHAVVDTDCVLAALVEESWQPGREGLAIADALGLIGLDAEALMTSLNEARPEGRPILDGPRGSIRLTLSGRVERVLQRAVAEAYRLTGPGSECVTARHFLHGVRSEDRGPAAEALRQCGSSPEAARDSLGIPNPSAVHIRPPLWPPPPRNSRGSEPASLLSGGPTDDRVFDLAVDSPEPSLDTVPASFVWTSEGQQFEIWNQLDGSIHLRVRAGTQASIVVSPEAAELIVRVLEAVRAEVEDGRATSVEAPRADGRQPPSRFGR
jgi:hypothetical protein